MVLLFCCMWERNVDLEEGGMFFSWSQNEVSDGGEEFTLFYLQSTNCGLALQKASWKENQMNSTKATPDSYRRELHERLQENCLI